MKFDEGVCRTPVVRVKRDGPRGWKWINADAFDPRVHELYDDRAQQSPVKAKVGKSKPDADPQRGDFNADSQGRAGAQVVPVGKAQEQE